MGIHNALTNLVNKLGLKACFAAGTPLRIKGGWKCVEDFVASDKLLSRSEFDPTGVIEEKEVEEVFVRLGRIFHLHVSEEVIRTTSEHPFYANNKGWIDAGLLEEGDWLITQDGNWVRVQEVFDTGEYEKVYNLRVADWHTYFVGKDSWGFSVWAHNAYEGSLDPAVLAREAGRRKKLRVGLETQTAARKEIIESVYAEAIGQGDTLLGKLGISLDRNLNHLQEISDAALGKSHIIYLLRERASGEIVYIGRASELGNPMQAFRERVRKGHEVYDPNLHDVYIVEVAPTRSIVRGAEEVYLVGLRDQGIQLMNGEKAWGVGYDNAARAKKALDLLQDFLNYLTGGQRG